MSDDLRKKYDEASKWYEEKYVSGGWENNPYMKDEYDAHKFWMNNGEVGKIVSLGVGSGQDIDILGKFEANSSPFRTYSSSGSISIFFSISANKSSSYIMAMTLACSKFSVAFS